ncbi:hypothetical protein SG0102_02400 [Intestinibaculum porci]|uniref:DUF7601 domain-containing protein n=2 Tax=Intestinibaculum porci TaxID=2487118 RepID=A0A3G9J3G3_9FIRM|nr:hypothetical protein SG0102_02400 [Intestinibaculum porci]
MAGAIMNAVPAFAANNTGATADPSATVTTKTTFDKYLVMKKNANVPNATFSYTVSIPTDDEMKSLPNPEDTNGTNLTIRKGIGSPTASSTTFEAGDQTFDSAQTVRTNTDSKTYDEKTADQVIGLDKDHKYAKQTSTVDFSKVTFSEPGVYRYKITENDTSEKGITKDSTARYLDVYVESDDNGKLSIQGYVFHTANKAQKKDGTNPEEKNKGFTNTYTTQDLTLTKTVTGNQGFRDQYFKFHVDITDLDGGARLFLTDKDGHKPYKSTDTVAYAYNAGTGKRDGGQKRFVATEGKGSFADVSAPAGADADMSGLALTANDSGNASFDVYLKHGESLKVNGLTEGAKYTVTETSEDYSASATKNAQAIDLTHSKDDHTDAIATQTLAGDETIAYTNDREGVLPTGIYHNNRAAFNIMGIAAAGGAIAIVIRKRRKNVEQALKNSNK